MYVNYHVWKGQECQGNFLLTERGYTQAMETADKASDGESNCDENGNSNRNTLAKNGSR